MARALSSILVTLAMIIAVTAQQNPENNNIIASGNNQFALEMYSALAVEGRSGDRRFQENLIFSPYSISSALAMTYGGAKGDTATEMEKTLHFKDGKEIHAAFAKLNETLDKAQKDGKIKLFIANSLWPQTGHNFLPDYLSLVKKNYGSSVTPLDFKTDSRGAVEKINRWVEDKTQDKIKNLFSQLDASTRLVLVNAIYFKGNWDKPFSPKETRDEDFTLAGGEKIKTPMMHLSKNFGYAKAEGIKLLEMPYEGDQLSMIAILPDDVAGIAQLEKDLTPQKLESWIGQLRGEKVIVAFPKFKITWGATQLNDTLKKLGIRAAFDAGAADFSGMDGAKDLFLSQVVHKAFVEVNEEGTEAAAATGAAMSLTMAPPSEPAKFIADHPFIFLIREKTTGQILFMGRVMDPAK